MAQRCVTCPVCRRARAKQRGMAFLFVKLIEGRVCPYCRAYQRVYGRKAHEPAGELEDFQPAQTRRKEADDSGGDR